MITKNIFFKSFLNIKKNKKITKDFQKLLKDQPPLFETLKPTYKYSYSKETISKYKKFSNIRVIGMGGSILGTEAIYFFLKNKIKKKLTFVNNLNSNADYFQDKNINLNLIISKSGNTLETIANANALIKNKESNIIITENKESYLTNLANKLKAEIFEHKNYVGGRYSVLSEVGMLPAELMGLNENKFKQFNQLIKNKEFTNNLINNVGATLNLIKKGKHTSRPSAGNISFHSHGTLYMAALRTLVAHSSLNHLCTQAFIVSHNVYTLFAPATAATAPIDTINSSIPNQSRLSILDCK